MPKNDGETVTPWVQAARPRTLPAAVVPVVIGSALAADTGHFMWLPAVLCLSFALLVQVGTNYANDYFDFCSGADGVDRVGPMRACAAGLIRSDQMWFAAKLVLATAFCVGCGLIPFGGWWLVGVGVASLVCAVAYTGGPFPLGYNGLGDLFVILFFGLVAVVFTVYVQAGRFVEASFPVALGTGLLINNLLVVNNHRDLESDSRSAKRTLVVRFGRRFAEWQYLISFLLAGVLVVVAFGDRPALAITGAFPVLSGFNGWAELRSAKDVEAYGASLQSTARTVVLFGIGLPLGMLVDRCGCLF